MTLCMAGQTGQGVGRATPTHSYKGDNMVPMDITGTRLAFRIWRCQDGACLA